MKKLGLLPKLILGIILGIVIGKLKVLFVVELLATFNGLFGNFLGFVIPLIIIGFVAPGIGDLGTGAGKLLGIAVLIAYGSTIVSGSFAYIVDTTLFPSMLKGSTIDLGLSNPEHALVPALMHIDMPPIMGVMSALLIAFVIGLGITAAKGHAIKDVMNEFQGIVEGIIKSIIIPLLPIHICGIFANMTYAGQVETIISVFAKVFAIIIAMHLIIIVVQYTFAGLILNGKNPFVLIKNMVPAYLTAVGTQSSAATIPVTLAQTKQNGVEDGIAEFTIPLFATIHLSGSTITLTSCALAIMMLTGMPITFSMIFGFILMLGVTMVAAPGVPGGAVMAALGLLESMLGFDQNLLGLMIALYLAQDSFGTACNITGDGALAMVVNKIAGFKLEKIEK